MMVTLDSNNTLHSLLLLSSFPPLWPLRYDRPVRLFMSTSSPHDACRRRRHNNKNNILSNTVNNTVNSSPSTHASSAQKNQNSLSCSPPSTRLRPHRTPSTLRELASCGLRMTPTHQAAAQQHATSSSKMALFLKRFLRGACRTSHHQLA